MAQTNATTHPELTLCRNCDRFIKLNKRLEVCTGCVLEAEERRQMVEMMTGGISPGHTSDWTCWECKTKNAAGSSVCRNCGLGI